MCIKFNRFFAIFLVTLAMSFITSCDRGEDKTETPFTGDTDNYFLQLDNDNLSFTAYGGSQKVKLKASGKWSFKKVPDWLTIQPSEGSGNTDLEITAEANNSKSDRSREMTITWYAGNNSNESKFSVFQRKDSLTISQNYYFLMGLSNEGKDKLKIQTVCGWKASSNKSWCNVSEAKGVSDKEIFIIVEENNTLDAREAIITISKDTTRTLQMEFVKVVVKQLSRNLPQIMLTSIKERTADAHSADYSFTYSMGVAGEGYVSKPVTEIGLCYSSTIEVPTIENTSVVNIPLKDIYVDSIEGTLTGLESNTKYYVCAYAKCEYGTSYSEVKVFTTKQ